MTNLAAWLADHARVCDAIVWEASAGQQAYPAWPQGRKAALQSAFDTFLAGGAYTFPDPVPNALNPAANKAPDTAFTPANAWPVYLAYLAHSLALDVAGTLTWRLDDYDAEDLALLLNSRSLFTRQNGKYRLDPMRCECVPAPPSVVWEFLHSNGIVDPSRRETTGRLLEWCGNLSHFIGSGVTSNMEKHWHYRGWAPASRLIAGTVRTGDQERKHWTGGCRGTNGFLRTVLRSINVPCSVEFGYSCLPGKAPHRAHALTHFTAEDSFLSHADDPYSSLFRAIPDARGTELLIDNQTFRAWFANGVPPVRNCANVGRRPWQVGLAELWRGQWTRGWTSFVPLSLDGTANYLAYKVGNGEVNIDRVRPKAQGTDTIWGAQWTTGWSSFVPFKLSGEPHYLAYKYRTGEVAIDRVRPDGQGVDTIWRGTWTTGWSSFVPFSLLGAPHYLAYKIGTGEVAVDRIRPDGQGVDTIRRASLAPGWTSFGGTRVDDGPGFVVVKSTTGEIALDRIRPDGSVESRHTGNEGNGWTAVLPFSAGRREYVLLYQVVTGAVRLLGVGTEIGDPHDEHWTPGWTSIVRLRVENRPLLLTYKNADGTVTLGRLFG
jgi:hypothetical protein